MISDKIKNLVRFTLSVGASTYMQPHAMQKAPAQTKEDFAKIGLTAEELLQLTPSEATLLGFTRWEEENPTLHLIPVWLYPALPKGILVTSISGEETEFDKETHDSETRYGCLAYGIHLVEPDFRKL